MARGMGLPPLPHGPHGHPLAGHPAGLNGAPHLTPHHVLTSSASGVIGRPTSTPSTGTSAFNGKSLFSKTFFKNQRNIMILGITFTTFDFIFIVWTTNQLPF